MQQAKASQLQPRVRRKFKEKIFLALCFSGLSYYLVVGSREKFRDGWPEGAKTPASPALTPPLLPSHSPTEGLSLLAAPVPLSPWRLLSGQHWVCLGFHWKSCCSYSCLPFCILSSTLPQHYMRRNQEVQWAATGKEDRRSHRRNSDFRAALCRNLPCEAVEPSEKVKSWKMLETLPVRLRKWEK